MKSCAGAALRFHADLAQRGLDARVGSGAMADRDDAIEEIEIEMLYVVEPAEAVPDDVLLARAVHRGLEEAARRRQGFGSSAGGLSVGAES